MIGLRCGLATVCASAEVWAQSCSPEERTLRYGFYARFEPVSYSADPDRGYEADLLTALKALAADGIDAIARGSVVEAFRAVRR